MRNEGIGYFLSKNFRPVMITIGTIIALCVVGIIVVIVHNLLPEKTYISVNVAPHEASVQINGQTFRNGTYEFSPGDYSVTVSADGFDTKTFNIDVARSQTTPVATFLLNQKEGMDYFEKSSADLAVLATLSDPEAQSFMQKYNRKTSIRDYFPIYVNYNKNVDRGIPGNSRQVITVDDGSGNTECMKAFCLLISSPYNIDDGINMAYVEDEISDLGYNINDYEVIYGS